MVSTAPGADQLPPAAHLDQQRRAVGLAKIAVAVAEVGRAVGLPDRLARLLVQRDDELHVDAVHVEDQQVVDQHGRGARPAEVVAMDVAAAPKHLAAGRVEAGGAVDAEVDVHPARPRSPAWARRSCSADW